ncbi:MAG: synthase epsilon subunit [Symbiobacteriaceae bacterium]|jgi:F-type H+-transporting ATPase subunit epsilon|nr:synthase epsilon subunit [Symbiobacteriaceae bacterium]
MAGEMTLQIVTPEGTVVKDVKTDAVIIPASEGSMGILHNHAPMVTALKVGVLRYKQGGHYKRVALAGGFMELSNNLITVLADTAEIGETIDVLRAQEARKRAETRLRDRAANVDRTRAEIALQRAMARLKAAGKLEDKD